MLYVFVEKLSTIYYDTALVLNSADAALGYGFGLLAERPDRLKSEERTA